MHRAEQLPRRIEWLDYQRLASFNSEKVGQKPYHFVTIDMGPENARH
jgi:hypothetical protein